MKLNKNTGSVNHQAVSVLNKVDLKDNDSAISADNLPVGMVEDAANTQSSNFGTDRPLQGGKCIVFNATVYFNIPASNGDISSVSALDETGAIVSMSATFVTDHYEISGIDGNGYWNIKCWGIGATPTDSQKKSYTLVGSIETDLFTWLKADSGSTTTLYKAYTGGVDGIIQNYYEGFWGEQNEYSYLDEVGYSDNLYSSGRVTSRLEALISNITYPDDDSINFDVDYSTEITNLSVLGIYRTPINYFPRTTGQNHTVKFNILSNIDISSNISFNFRWNGNPNSFLLSSTHTITSLTGGVTTSIEATLTDNGVQIDDDVTYKLGFLGFFFTHSGNDTVANITISDLEIYYGSEDLLIPKDESITLPPFKDVQGNDLQYIGKAPSRASFVEGNCFHGLDGGRNDLEFGDTPSFNLQNIQVSLWIKKNTNNGYAEIFALQQKNATAKGLALIDYYAVQEYAIVYSNGTSTTQIGTGYKQAIDGLFHHVTVKHTTSNNILIIDGVEVFRLAHTDTIGYTTGSLNHICGGINFAMEHDVYDIKVQEIDPVTEQPINNLLAYWPLPEYIQDPSNHTAFDVSGNGNHATLINGSIGNRGVANKPDGYYEQLGLSRYFYFNENASFIYNEAWDTLEFYSQHNNLNNWGDFLGASLNANPYFRSYTNQFLVPSNPITPVPGIFYKHKFINGNGIDTPLEWYINDILYLTFNINSKFLQIKLGYQNGQYLNGDILNLLVDGKLIIAKGTIPYANRDNTIIFAGSTGTSDVRVYDVPSLSTDLTKDALGNPLTIQQDGKSFLDAGNKIAVDKTPRVVQADIENNIVFDVDGNPKAISWGIVNGFGARDGKYFSSDKDTALRQIAIHKAPLTRKQYETELLIRKCTERVFQFPYTFPFILE